MIRTAGSSSSLRSSSQGTTRFHVKHPFVAPTTTLRVRCDAVGVALGGPEAALLIAFLDRMFVEPQNLTAIRDLDVAIDRHLVDSLWALRLPAIAHARRLVDIGSGAGFPGVALAVARPDLQVTLVESERAKADWLTRATHSLANVHVVHDRAETLARARRHEWDVVTARAVGGLSTVLELAAPLLADEGSAVLWRGRRDTGDEWAGAQTSLVLGLLPGPVTHAQLHDGSTRHLHEFTRTGIVPSRFPRRPGLAAKRPISSRPAERS